MERPHLFMPRAHVLPRWAIVACAGFAAGTVATVAQVLLLLALGEDVAAIMLRDARLTAALLLGRGVLPPPLGFDAWIWLVAGLIHFALSIVYVAPLWLLVRRTGLLMRRTGPLALAAGALFGLALYGVNLYGFTAVFPWFAQARGASAAFAHAVFGLTAVAAFQLLAVRSGAPRSAGH